MNKQCRQSCRKQWSLFLGRQTSWCRQWWAQATSYLRWSPQASLPSTWSFRRFLALRQKLEIKTPTGSTLKSSIPNQIFYSFSSHTKTRNCRDEAQTYDWFCSIVEHVMLQKCCSRSRCGSRMFCRTSGLIECRKWSDCWNPGTLVCQVAILSSTLAHMHFTYHYTSL